jgi:hypothetical protein
MYIIKHIRLVITGITRNRVYKMKILPFSQEILNELECIRQMHLQTSNQLLHKLKDVTLEEEKGKK